MMNDALSRYLVELATNPTTLGEFRRDPSSARGRVAEADAELLLASSSSDALHARLTKPEDLVGDTGERELYEVAAADLTIVGSGIRAVGQFTIEALAAITAADKVWYLMSNEVGVAIIRALNPNCDSLTRLYVEGGLRRRTYEQMADLIVSSVRVGARTCAVFYGHPGVFVYPSHLAVEIARGEGYVAELLPGVSAEDCVYADLGLDPGALGWQSYEATDFLMHERNVEVSAGLLLWQVGVVGEWNYSTGPVNRFALRMLVEKLLQLYPADHEPVLYEAAVYPGSPTRKEVLRLDRLTEAAMTSATTLYIPPLRHPEVDAQWWTNRHAMAPAPGQD